MAITIHRKLIEFIIQHFSLPYAVTRLTTSHAKVLISLVKHSQSQFREGLDAFLTNGGNLLWRHSSWGTVLSLIMRHGASFDCLREHLLRQPEPWLVNELLPMDRWLLGILEQTDGRFRSSLQKHNSKYRSANQVSQVYQDVDMIVTELQAASTRDRVEFLKIVSKWGTRDMIMPFIKAGFDLNERPSNEQMPWLRLSYLSKAMKWGNLDTFETLLDAGACPTQALIYLSRYPDSFPPCQYPALREKMILTLARAADLRHLEGREQEQFSLFLRTDNVRKYCSATADRLVERFISTDDTLEVKSEKVINSYILAAIFLDLPQVLLSFYHWKLQLSGNEIIGKVFSGQRVVIKGDVVGQFTWLTFAVHLGRTSCVKLFLENGADCTRSDPHGRTALQMAQEYVTRPHPRATINIYMWPYQPQQRAVSADDDREILAMIQTITEPQISRSLSSKNESDHGKATLLSIETDTVKSLSSDESDVHFGLKQLLVTFGTLVAVTLQPLTRLAHVIRNDYPINKLRSTTVKLLQLTFMEALLLRTGYVASLIALLLYILIDLLLRGQDLV